MVLPKKLLEGFLYFEHEYKQITEDYIDYGEDYVTIYREKTRKFLPDKKIKDVYRFRRHSTENDQGQRMFKATESYNQLLSQLNDIQHENWNVVDDATYKWLKENHPDRLL